MSIDKETADKFRKANAANIAKKLKEGKTLSSSEARQLKEYESTAEQADESRARKIITEGLAIMKQVAEIIEASKLSKRDKQAIREKILALNAE